MAPRRGLLDNLPYKILALLVGVVVWFNVTENIRFQEEVSVPLRLENLPAGFVLVNQPPAAVRVRVAAPGRFVRLRSRGIEVPVDLSSAHAGRTTRLLTTADVLVPHNASIEVVRILSPTSIVVECDSLTAALVPVVAWVQGTPAEEFGRSGDVRVVPPLVRLEGPKRLVESVQVLTTEEVSLDGAREGIVQSAAVSLAGLGPVRATPPSVRVEVPIERIERFPVSEVPVRLKSQLRRGQVIVAPATVRLEVQGVRSLFDRWNRSGLVLLIEVDGLAPGVYEYAFEPAEGGRVRLVPASPGTRELGAALRLPDFLTLASLEPRLLRIRVE